MSEHLLIDPNGAWSPITRKPTLLAIGGLSARTTVSALQKIEAA